MVGLSSELFCFTIAVMSLSKNETQVISAEIKTSFDRMHTLELGAIRTCCFLNSSTSFVGRLNLAVSAF